MKKMKPNLMAKANIFSYILFWWMNDFFKHGFKTNLQESDMFELEKSDTSTETCGKLERNWQREVELSKNRKPSFFRAVVRTYGMKYMMIGSLAFAQECLRTGIPVMIAGLLRFFEHSESTPLWHAYAYAAGISVASFLLIFFPHLYFFNAHRIGWHIRASACALMYKKTLRLSQRALGQTTTGQIVNLGATDVIRFDYFPMFLHFLWIGPLQCIVVVIIMWQEVGPAIFAGMAVFILIMILQMIIGRVFGKLRSLTAVLTDERIRLMNEMIAGMRIIKMYTWEESFAGLVASSRKKEIDKILQSSVLRAINVTISICQEKVLTFATLLAYVAMGGEITASKVFILIGLSSAQRITVGFFFGIAIERLSDTMASMKRIETYLLSEEVAKSQGSSVPNTSEQSFVKVKNFSGKWAAGGDDAFCLRDISVRVNTGQLLAVIGPVGAGKSSFLSAILGEMPRDFGEVNVHGKLSFANQVPWVFSGTVRENILFDDPYDPVWYEKDLKELPNGDLTLVGERGVTLSGGQKSRVNLARAVYRKAANICLMDDPLSAVDATVANHIYHECICGLMKDRLRILVTHQVQLLKDADHIIILKEGKIDKQGTYDELQADGTDFASLLQKKDVEVFEEDEGEKCILKGSPSFERSTTMFHARSSTRDSRRSTRSTISMSCIKEDEFEATIEPEELREQGSIGIKVYIEYFRVGVSALFLLFFLLVIPASHVICTMNDWFLSHWTRGMDQFRLSMSQNESSQLSNDSSRVTSSSTVVTMEFSTIQPVEFDTQFYLIIYSAISVTMIVIVLLRTLMHFYLCAKSGIQMHNKMLRQILRSPIRFFDTNPVGRILNRFSKDMGQIDEILPWTFMDFLFVSGIIISVIILISVINYFVLIVIIPLFVYFIWLRRYFIRTSRDIKRLEGALRSPVFSLLSSTLQGLLTIRANGIEEEFEKKFHDCQDLHSSAWFLFICGSRWFAMRLDIITATFITSVTMLSVVSASILSLDPGAVGLALTYSASVIDLLQWGVRQSTEVENMMTSVERVQQYYRLTPEAADEVPEKKPHSDWPINGAIKFENVSFAYSEKGPIVLKNINFETKPNEKVGVVGRTGAGKSSLIAALFRLSELRGGEIYIDGIPITPLGLNDVRKALSIIPQDPILFTGTMRHNLDPFSNYSDDELWNALEQVQLREVVAKLSSKLDTELAESGSNFSVGQRQLVCLARAILRKSKILVIDEATASVDVRTDRLIQLTIREKFKLCTIITIAHRINTIIDSDRIMLLDAGKLKEFDDPHNLLQIPNGYFKNLVKNTGYQEAEKLEEIAKEMSILKHHE